MNNVVTHKNIIKGVLKEALFLDLEAQVDLGGTIIHGRIVELSDNETEAMMLYLDLDEGLPTDLPMEAQISVFFKNFMARFQVQISFWRMPFLMLHFPDEITLSNERTETRHHLGEDAATWTRVALDNGTTHVVAQFRPTNLSQNGIGGELTFPEGFELRPDTSISGDHWYNGQWIKIGGVVRSMRQLTTLHDGNTFCIVGVENTKLYSKSKGLTHIPRPTRNDSKIEIEFSFMANAEKSFRLSITNVSVGGFLAQISDSTVQSLALISKLATMVHSTMQAQLVSYSGNDFRFQWVAGMEADRLKWLKEISTFMGPDIDSQSLKKDDILGLFCQSGALSDQYLKEQRALSKELLKALEKGSLNEPWIYRWTNRGEEGKAKGYVSALKSGDNSWSIIDIVSDRYGDKMSKTFIPNFFVSLMDFSLALTPCPTHFIGWVKSHPFFAKFEQYMDTVPDYVLGKAEMLYTRLKKDFTPSSTSKFQKTKIEATDFSSIKKIRTHLESNGLLEFADSMDFNTHSFSSTNLAQLLKKHSHPFKREYWKFALNQEEFFCVFTLIPEGQNPGRWVDSIFVFDLNDKLLNEPLWQDLKNELIILASSMGYSTHAIRRLAKKGHEDKYKDEVAHLSAFILHPKAWEFYRKA